MSKGIKDEKAQEVLRDCQGIVMGNMKRQGGSQTTEALEYHTNKQGDIL